MAFNSKDEDYLEQLLSSVAEGNNADSDEWFAQELEGGGEDISFEEELSDVNQDIEAHEVPSREESDTAVETNAVEEPEEEERTITEFYDLEEPADTDNADISEKIDTTESDDDIEDILNMINAIEQGESEEKENLIESDIPEQQEEDNRTIRRYEDIHSEEEDLIQDKTKGEKDESNRKSKGFLGGLFSKKKQKGKEKKLSEQSDDNSLIDMERVLEETGSVMDDMDSLGLNDLATDDGFDTNSSNGFNVDEELEGIEEKKSEKDKKKEKKEKKPKKEKKVKASKDKKKIKPVKPVRREEMIRVTPLGVVLSLSVIAASVCVIYFGAGFFSYNKNIDAATSYYVDKNYTKAYTVLAGMDLNKEDKPFYKQVVNVMKVEKYYNEFNTYYKLEMYADALDSLIRGIKSYDSVVDDARELGTFDQTTDSFGKIIDCLSGYYSMTESEARQLAQMADREEYSKIIYNKASNIKISEKGISEQ